MGTALTQEQKITHLLSRMSFGATPEEREKITRMGGSAYLEEQLQPERIPDPIVEERLKQLKTVRLSSKELFELYPPPNQAKKQGVTISSRMQGPRYVIFELQQARLLRAVYSRRQLYEVMVDFWTNHFNVFAAKGADRWLVTSYDRDTIRPHAFGKFKDLLRATAQSPAMLFYLDNWLSVNPEAALRARGADGNPSIRRGINENYARELMELHTLGVDSGYNQKDVEQVARCFTGWTIRRPRGEAEFQFNSRFHDRGEKIVLGVRIAAGGGMEDGMQVIDLLARHPATARFIAAKLVRRFVADDPPPALVTQAAEAFRRSDGDIRSVLSAVVSAPEFYSSEAYRAKVKKPLEFVASALRAVDAETDGGPPLLRYLGRMGEPLFLSQPPTGYPDVASSWISPDALLTRMNFALDLAANRIRGTRARREVEPLLLAGPEFQRR